MKPYHRNPRRISKERLERLADTLARLGDLGGIVHNLETDEIIGGNQRMAVFRDGKPVVLKTYAEPDAQGTVGQGYIEWRGHQYAYRQVRWDDETAAEANIAANLGAGDWDWDILANEWDTGALQSWGMDAELVQGWSEDIAALKSMLESEEPPQVDDPGPQIDKAAELQAKWQTAPGQLWALGDHRLIIGDCTDAAVVARVMDGEKAQLVVTSPPYAVGKEYEVGVSFPEHLAMLRNMADRCIENVVAGGFIFTNFGEIAAQSHAGPLTGSDRQCIYLISKDYWQIFHEERGCDLYAQRIWYKPFNRLQQPFWSYKTSIPHYQEWEHIWTWRTPGGEGDRRTDWDISVHAVWDTRDEATDDKPLTRHVAAFPVCLPERAIKAHSLVGEIVLEPFSGSGTTIIACENLNRRCRAIEIDAGYAAVAIERWAVATGKTPELVEDGTATG